MRLKSILLLSATVTATFGGAVAASAQAGPLPSAGEANSASADIIVTAERCSTSIQNTPLQITAITGEKLEPQPSTDVLQLGQRQPEVVFTQRFCILQTSIRGVGGDDNSLGTNPRVAFHINGVYVARGSAQMGGLYDSECLEIVQGPQGALYGRNATGGAINVITAAPTGEFSGHVTQTIGDHQFFKTDGAVSGPVVDGLGVRIAAQLVDRSGFGRQFLSREDINDQRRRAARFSASG